MQRKKRLVKKLPKELPHIDEVGNTVTLHPTKGIRRVSAKRARYYGRR